MRAMRQADSQAEVDPVTGIAGTPTRVLGPGIAALDIRGGRTTFPNPIGAPGGEV